MKVRFKIALAFMLLTILVLAAICILTYYIVDKQQQRDFDRRMHNRTATISSLLSKLPSNNSYQILSKLDTATNNTLSRITVSVFEKTNKPVYQFARNYNDKIDIDTEVINEARKSGNANSFVGERRIVAVSYKLAEPIVVVITAIDENGKKNLNELVKALSVAFITGSILSFLVGWLFSGRLLKPVEKIATTVNNISANNISERLAESGAQDEWDKLAVTFNNLLQRLQDSFEVQGRFISNASHELSTPLTAVSNQIDVILQNTRTNEEYLAVLHSIRDDVHHMSALTQQLLNIARTARGGMVNTESTRVDEILMELPSLLKKITPQYIAQLVFDDLPENEKLCTINGNYELLLSAFRNIAENGCKYAPDHTVNISLSFANARIQIHFSNRYEYFKPDEIEKIFQPFQRGSNAANEPGYGLGLSLTRRIILLHKGEIKAEIIGGNRLQISVILPSSDV